MITFDFLKTSFLILVGAAGFASLVPESFVADVNASSSEESNPVSSGLDDENELFALLNEMRFAIDRSAFDLETLLERLDYDAEEILRFAKKEIGFEAYSGLLRSAQGTLISRAGNSLDQALLVATLLNDAGYEARINRSELTKEDAALLLKQILVQRSPSQVVEAQEFSRVYSDIKSALGVSESPDTIQISQKSSTNFEDSEPYLLMTEQTALLTEAISGAGRQFGENVVPRDLISILQDYFWVEYREGASSPWVDEHPAFGGDYEPEILEVSQTFAGELPAEFQHRLRLQAFIEVQRRGTKTISPLMSPWEVPAANLIGKTITYANEPMGAIAQEPDPESSSHLPETTKYMPLLNGVMPEGAVAFDLLGNTIDPIAAGSHMAGIFEQVGRGFLSAAESIHSTGQSNTDTQQALLMLERVWLEIVLIRPGGEEKKFIRLLASPGSENKRINSLPRQQIEISVAGGDVPLGILLDRSLAQLQNLGVQYGVPQTNTPATDSSMATEFDALYFFWLATQGSELDPETASYYSEPAIVARHSGVRIGNSYFEGFDIVNNTRRSFRKSGSGDVSQSPLHTLRRGVWETVVETYVRPRSSRASFNTLIGFADLPDGQGLSDTIAVSSSAQLQSIKLRKRSKDLIGTDINQGYFVILPRKAVENDRSPLSWWRVNLSTGETLGRASPMGWGSDINEYDVISDLMEWLSCSANVRASCEKQLMWARGITEFLFRTAEALNDPSGKEWSWWDWLTSLPDNPIIKRVVAILEAKTGVSLSGATPAAYIQSCWERNVSEECGDNPYGPGGSKFK